jgi:peroxiredoxin
MKSFFQKHQVLFSIAVLILGIAWISFAANYLEIPTDGHTTAPKEGFQAPDISLETMSGNHLKLSDLRGDAVLVNFWASWCLPCRSEMPAMQKVYDAYKDDNFIILAVNATHQDSLDNVKAFVTSNNLSFPILVDIDGAIAHKYLVRSFPTSFYIDKHGIVNEVIIGGPMSEALLETRIQRLIEGEN